MNKKLLLAALGLLPAAAFAQTGGAYTIQGKIGTLSAPAKIYLEYRINDKTQVDSATLTDGAFKFSGNIASVKQGYLVLNVKGDGLSKARDYKSVYLEAGTITVEGTTDLSGATVAGTKNNVDNQQYNAALKSVNDAYEALEAKKKATPEVEQNDAFNRQYNADEKQIERNEAEANKKFIQDHPDSYVSINALQSYVYSADYKDINPLYENLSPAIKGSDAGKDFALILPKLKAVALGATAPVFTEADTAGKQVSLTSFRGKYVLIDFWASWCGPCRHENPNVVKAYGHYKGKNFTIIGVSLDRQNGRDKWLAAIHKDGLTWTQVSDLQFWKSKTADLYGVRAIPQNFLLDPNGKIIAKNLTGNDLEDKLEEIFGKI